MCTSTLVPFMHGPYLKRPLEVELASILESKLGQKWGYGALKAYKLKQISSENNSGFKGFSPNRPPATQLLGTEYITAATVSTYLLQKGSY